MTTEHANICRLDDLNALPDPETDRTPAADLGAVHLHRYGWRVHDGDVSPLDSGGFAVEVASGPCKGVAVCIVGEPDDWACPRRYLADLLLARTIAAAPAMLPIVEKLASDDLHPAVIDLLCESAREAVGPIGEAAELFGGVA